MRRRTLSKLQSDFGKNKTAKIKALRPDLVTLNYFNCITPNCHIFICNTSQYFKMRFVRHSKKEWMDIKWRGATIMHTRQQDSHSCGVLVMQVFSAQMVSIKFETLNRINSFISLQLLFKDGKGGCL